MSKPMGWTYQPLFPLADPFIGQELEHFAMVFRSTFRAWFLCPVMFHITQLKRGYEFQQIFWLVVSTPLKNMKVNWDDDIPNIWENKQWQPNHQPEYFFRRCETNPPKKSEHPSQALQRMWHFISAAL